MPALTLGNVAVLFVFGVVLGFSFALGSYLFARLFGGPAR